MKVRESHGEVKQVNGKRVPTPEYRAWQVMRNRVLNKNCKDYWRYAGKGICKRWDSFTAFLQDMGRKPSPLHTLERKNNAKGYNKSNCCWATRTAQARNRGAYNRFTLKDALKIRKLYATGLYYQYEIAALYGTHQAHISQIVRNAHWKGDA